MLHAIFAFLAGIWQGPPPATPPTPTVTTSQPLCASVGGHCEVTLGESPAHACEVGWKRVEMVKLTYASGKTDVGLACMGERFGEEICCAPNSSN